jgi:hypothetical protein
MKVKELIQKLEELDQDLEITYESEGYFCEINEIAYFNGKYYSRTTVPCYYIS